MSGDFNANDLKSVHKWFYAILNGSLNEDIWIKEL